LSTSGGGGIFLSHVRIEDFYISGRLLNGIIVPLFYRLYGFMEQEALFNAIREGDMSTVRKLVEQTPGLTGARDQRGSTPLILAAYYNQGQIVELLLDRGAGVNETDGAGNTALMGCCFKGFAEVAEKLITAGADVNKLNSLGSSCLIYAVTFNQLEIAKLLLKSGADKHIRDGKGLSAIDHAKMQGFAHFRPLLS
jgi:ankyrin repeat protein